MSALGVVVASVLALGVEANPPASADVPALLDAWIRSGVTVGLSVAVIDGDDVKFYNAGVRARTGGQAVDEHTLYEIGSVTKVFTALLLAEMAERGQVRLDDPIDGFLPPGIKPPQRDGNSITLRNLAQHTSSLPRLPDNFAPADERDPYADYTEARLFDFLNGFNPPRAMGEKYEYSNLGAGLLGTLLARRAGTDYSALVNERICKPLGLASTTAVVGEAMEARRAAGHHGAREVSPWHFSALAGCGALYSSAADMARFVQAHLNGESGPLTAAMRACVDESHAVPTTIPNTSVTLGWHVAQRTGGRRILWHNGGTGGFRSFVGFDPLARRGVVVLTNSTSSVDHLGMHLIDPSSPLEPLRESVAVSAEVLQRYVGKYRLTPLHEFDVTLENGQLFARLTGQDSLPLWPESETKFFYREVDAQLTFERDAEGRVQALVLHQYGMDQRAARVPSAP